MFWKIPKVIPELFFVLKHGCDVPQVRDAIYLEILKHAYKFPVWLRIKRLARSWWSADARYLGIMLIGDILEMGDRPWAMRRARRDLIRLAKTEKDSRNAKLITSLLDISPATAVTKRLGRRAIARTVLQVANPPPPPLQARK